MTRIESAAAALSSTNLIASDGQRRQGAFEIHLAAPAMGPADEEMILQQLKEIGIHKSKYFLNVLNVPTHSEFCFPAGTPPTGHDLDNPHIMSTAVVPSLVLAAELIEKGMEVFRKHGKKGNFEIEWILGENSIQVEIDADKRFPEFKRIEDSPRFENHLIFRGTQATLPPFCEITEAFQTCLGINVHQIVDFARCRKEAVDGKTRVSRVATVYQPSKDSALELANRIRRLPGFLKYDLLISEQVCLVGEDRQPDNARDSAEKGYDRNTIA